MTNLPSGRTIRLAARPVGAFRDSDFTETVDGAVAPQTGEALVRTLYLALEPAMRGWARDHRTYMEPVALGAPMRAYGVGQVVESRWPGLQQGEIVYGMLNMQEYATLPGPRLRPIAVSVDKLRHSLPTYLGPLGLSGATAYLGLFDIGDAKPGDVVLVSAASGAVGHLVGQLGKIAGCRVVGLAGSAAKCAYIVEELGFDGAIDYKTAGDLAAAIGEQCPSGVDIYFDNVGGAILEAALANLRPRGRVVCCGMISQYNNTGPVPGPSNLISLVRLRARMEGFIVNDHADRWDEIFVRLDGWITEGRIKHREDVVDGLSHAPGALRRLFAGENFGKLVVKVADPA